MAQMTQMNWRNYPRHLRYLRTLLEVPAQKIEEQIPLFQRERMPAGMIVERQLATDDRRIRRGKVGDAEILFAEEAINRPCSNFGEELPFRIGPLIGRTPSDENEPRGAEGDQHVRVDGHVVPSSDVLLQIVGELPREVLRHVVNGFAPIAPRQR